MGLHLSQINVVTPDVARTAEFYRLLGLDVRDTPGGWASHHRTVEGQGLDFDIDSAAFAQQYWASAEIPAGVALTFRVDTRDEVDEHYERATAAGHQGLHEPFDTFWGARYAIVRSPAGEAVGFMGPTDPERRSEPPHPSTFDGAAPGGG